MVLMCVSPTAQEANLDRLFSEVAPNAILNADGRADEVRCYPGTREEVIGKMEKWMGGNGSRMMWLSGPAGAGKSAICQTVAERCSEHGQQTANFFFFRGDTTRNSAQPLVATLAYQLRRLYPALDKFLAGCLEEDPLIFSASIAEQFDKLISSPIQMLQQSSSICHPIILIIDGLDECDDKRKQEQILVALHLLANEAHSPFLILVASRAEPHLVMSFNRIGSSAESIFLDDEYRPRGDIRHFVIAKFNEIKKLHSLAHTLSQDWPAEADIDAITDKSSGQFIYAATVMRFMEHSTISPALILLIVHGLRPSLNHSPLAQVDAVYSYIFSQVSDIRTVKLILCIQRITKSSTKDRYDFGRFLKLVGYETIEVESVFGDLAAIVRVAPGPPIELVFFHASLSDYLEDKHRSATYHVSTEELAVELASLCLKNFHDNGTSYDHLPSDSPYLMWLDSLSVALYTLWHAKEATEALSQSLLSASARQLDGRLGHVLHWHRLMPTIERLV